MCADSTEKTCLRFIRWQKSQEEVNAIPNLEKLQKMVANFPSRSSDVRYQKEMFDEILNVLGGLNHSKASVGAITKLRKEIEALKEAPR